MRVHERPRCGGESVRMRRGLVDRMHGMFIPAWGFRCSTLQCRCEGNVRMSVSTKRERALACADLPGATLVSALAMDGDRYVVSHIPASTEVLEANWGLAEYWGGPGRSGGLDALPAQSFHVDLQHESAAASGTT